MEEVENRKIFVEILVRHSFLDYKDESPYGNETVLFARWTPQCREDAIRIQSEGSPIIELWFEPKWMIGPLGIKYDSKGSILTEEEWKRSYPRDVGPLYTLITTEISTEILNALELGQNIRLSEGDSPLYESMGKKVVKLLNPAVINFRELLRIQYGHYWLNSAPSVHQAIDSMGSYFHDAWWRKIETEKWQKFKPNNRGGTVSTEIRFRDAKNYLNKTDWKKIEEALNDSHMDEIIRNPFVASALRAVEDDNLRLGFSDAATAVEISVGIVLKNAFDSSNKIAEKAKSVKDTGLPSRAIVAAAIKGIDVNLVEDTLEGIVMRNKVLHDGFPFLSKQEYGIRKNAAEYFKYEGLIHAMSDFAVRLITGRALRFPARGSGSNYSKEMEEYILQQDKAIS